MKSSRHKRQVLMISKPMVPPWDDSAKNIVRSQVTRGKNYIYRVLTDGTAASPGPDVIADPIYPGSGTYSPGLTQNIRVMLHGMRPRGASIYHYFFAPNPVTSIAGRIQKTLARVKTVQTICSAPAAFDGINRLLFSDRIIVLSDDTRQKMISAGVDEAKLRLVRPCIEPIDPPSRDERRKTRQAFNLPTDGPLIIFPGDYEFSRAANTVAGAIPLLTAEIADITVVFACRIKRAPSRTIRDEIKRELERSGHGKRARFVDNIPDMPAFVGAADVVVMPAESLYAKMDAPLVLLEAMAQRVPLVLADAPPLDELLSCGAGLAVPPGDSAALAKAVKSLLMNPNQKEEMGNAGARAVRDMFSAGTMTRTIEQIYDEVLYG